VPYYGQLRKRFSSQAERRLVIDKLLSLRAQLDRDIPAKDSNENLLLATWNIRDFDKINRRGFGKRLPETLYYIAEVISRFDFVAVQEVNQLGEWERVMDILGRDFDYMATDVTDRALGGNGERLTYVWDRRKVWFQKIAGEIVLPASMLIAQEETDDGKVVLGKQFRRSPFLASFQAGWFKFDICTVHLYYGADSGAKLDQRVEEIAAVAKYFGEKADIGLKGDRALILLGDFNIVSPEHKTMDALVDNGFMVPDALQQKTNVIETKYYDQIAFKTKPDVLEYIEKPDNAGVFKLFRTAMRKNQRADYDAAMQKTSALTSATYNGDLDDYYADWRTYQLSDHNPLWCRLQVNRSEDYLKRVRDE